MILIITHKEDYTSDFLINKLNAKKIEYVRWNCEDIINCNYQVDTNINFTFEGLNNFKAVWFRRTKLPNIENISNSEKIYLLNEYDNLLKNLFCTINAIFFKISTFYNNLLFHFLNSIFYRNIFSFVFSVTIF